MSSSLVLGCPKRASSQLSPWLEKLEFLLSLIFSGQKLKVMTGKLTKKMVAGTYKK
jgi:hypothetical protein